MGGAADSGVRPADGGIGVELRSFRDQVLRPYGAFSISARNPRLAPWAAFFRRFAAEPVLRFFERLFLSTGLLSSIIEVAIPFAPERLKPRFKFLASTARLKSCPSQNRWTRP